MFSFRERLTLYATFVLMVAINIGVVLYSKHTECAIWDYVVVEQHHTQQMIAKVRWYEKHQRQIMAVAKKYHGVDRNMIIEAVVAADQHQYRDFPRAKDLIALVGIESSWRPSVCSNLARDCAFGLTQVRPGVWKQLIGSDNIREVSTQIRVASDILHHYYILLNKNKRSALMAYNGGITGFFNNRVDPFYHVKFIKEIAYVDLMVKA